MSLCLFNINNRELLLELNETQTEWLEDHVLEKFNEHHHNLFDRYGTFRLHKNHFETLHVLLSGTYTIPENMKQFSEFLEKILQDEVVVLVEGD